MRHTAKPWRPPSRGRYEQWHSEMNQALTGFVQWGLPVEFSATHHTREALAQLEGIIDSRFPRGATDVLAPDADRRWIDGAVRYIGHTLITAFGGRWHYDPSPEALDPGRPIVVIPGVDDAQHPISVFGLVIRTATNPRQGVLTETWDRFSAPGDLP